MKKLQKILALLLAVMMIATVFAGCGEKTPAATTAGADNGTSDGDAASNKYAEPVELTFMTNTPVIKGSVGERIMDTWASKFNMKIKWLNPASSAYQEALNVMYLEDKKPDAVLIDKVTDENFKQCFDAGQFIDVSKMLKDYPNIVKYTAENSFRDLDLMHDGRIAGIPRSTQIRTTGYLMNGEWAKKLNIDFTELDYMTVDEAYEIARRFTFEDPDGNGKDDTYGFKADVKNGAVIDVGGMLGAFGVGNGWSSGWIEESPGFYMNPKYSKTNNGMKKYIEFANKCWKDGLLDPDAFSLDPKVSGQRLAQNKYGIWGSFAGARRFDPEIQGRTDIIISGITEKKGDPFFVPTYQNGIWGFWAISNTCKAPDRVLALLDYLLSDEGWQNLVGGGIEGEQYVVRPDGTIDNSAWLEKIKTMTKDESHGQIVIQMVRRAGKDCADFFVPKGASREIQDIIRKGIEISADNYKNPADMGYMPPVSKDSVYIEYDTFMNDEINKIIHGDKPLSYFDELLDGWYKNGGQTYVDQMNEYIKSQNKQ